MARRLTLWPVEDRIVADRGRRYRVTGYCSQCGDCCESGNPYTGEAGACPHFRRESPDRGVCTDRSDANHYYQIACRHWPSRPRHPVTYPRCTYVVTELT